MSLACAPTLLNLNLTRCDNVGEIFTDDYDQQWYFDTDVSLTIGPTSTGIDRTGVHCA